MTVKPVDDIIDQDRDQDRDLESSMDAVDIDRRISEKMKKVVFSVEEAEESGGSSTEEIESPKSVARFARKKAVVRGFVQHSQVVRIKEEEMLFAVDIGRSTLISKESPETTTTATVDRYPKRRVDVFLISRPILPCSPLSGRNHSTVGTALH